MRTLFLLLSVAQILAARDFQSLSWAKLGAAVADQEVTLILSSGTRLNGTVDRVLDDSLAVTIRKTSNSRLYPRGQASVPRKEVSEVRIKRIKGPYRAIFAAGIGAAGAFASLPWAISEERINVSDSSRIGAWIAVAGGSAAAGYFLGRTIDTHETVITISPY
jgi:hypothetical protein